MNAAQLGRAGVVPASVIVGGGPPPDRGALPATPRDIIERRIAAAAPSAGWVSDTL